MQQEAIVKLDRLRKTGAKKALAIAATGSGKTYMSVFDALQVKPNHLLFIVQGNRHQERLFVVSDKVQDCYEFFAVQFAQASSKLLNKNY